ncbi:unnamed protein product [Toxocara canis]|uniref:Uncharacterized protein n=1 Tax=Toxocara canis TaxID=6265 RepID=A0A183VEF7_TOXCA|nr:unnamed protein product [Toxocara canis]
MGASRAHWSDERVCECDEPNRDRNALIRLSPTQEQLPSEDCGANACGSMEVEDCVTANSPKTVLNGSGMHKLRANSKLEDATKERIAILDFGAQFGKVVNLFSVVEAPRSR